MSSATAIANPNIAFIKYWGNRDQNLRLPVNGSISMNLDSLFTRTRVSFSPDLIGDSLILDGAVQSGASLTRVSRFLDLVREMAGITHPAQVESSNNFPTGAGIASSASAYAAISLAASRAAGLELDEAALSRLARRGSGSAARSVPAGYVEWLPGTDDASSYASSIAPPDHWDLVDCIAVVSRVHKPTGSSEGHALAGTSPLQAARVADAPRRLDLCRTAILERDFAAFAAITEQDSNLMHAVMMTSTPNLFYWQPATLAVIQSVQEWRSTGLACCYTIDAGPNVHVLSTQESQVQVTRLLQEIPGVQQVLSARAGGAARLI